MFCFSGGVFCLVSLVVLRLPSFCGLGSCSFDPLTATLAHGTSRNFSPMQVVSRGFGFVSVWGPASGEIARRTASHTKGVGITAVPLIAPPVLFWVVWSVAILAQVRSLCSHPLWLPLRVSSRLLAAMTDTTRNVVSLDSSSSSSDSRSLEDMIAADAALGPMPFVSFSSIFAGQQRLRRGLDYMFEQVDGMQLKLDTLTAEVSAIKRRRT